MLKTYIVDGSQGRKIKKLSLLRKHRRSRNQSAIERVEKSQGENIRNRI